MADSSASPDAGASADVPAVQPTGEGVSAAGGEPASAPTRAAGVAEERKVPTDAYRTVFGEKGKTAIRMACQSFVTVAKKELRATAEEYKFVEQLNQVQSAEFAELHDNLTELGTFNANLSKRGKALEPYFQQVVELEQAIGELERMVDGLDRASWQLDTRLRQL